MSKIPPDFSLIEQIRRLCVVADALFGKALLNPALQLFVLLFKRFTVCAERVEGIMQSHRSTTDDMPCNAGWQMYSGASGEHNLCRFVVGKNNNRDGCGVESACFVERIGANAVEHAAMLVGVHNRAQCGGALHQCVGLYLEGISTVVVQDGVSQYFTASQSRSRAKQVYAVNRNPFDFTDMAQEFKPGNVTDDMMPRFKPNSIAFVVYNLHQNIVVAKSTKRIMAIRAVQNHEPISIHHRGNWRIK